MLGSAHLPLDLPARYNSTQLNSSQLDMAFSFPAPSASTAAGYVPGPPPSPRLSSRPNRQVFSQKMDGRQPATRAMLQSVARESGAGGRSRQMAICLPAWLACLLACLLACPSLSGGPYPSLILSISPSSFGLRPSVSIPTQRPNGTKLRSSLSHLPRSSPLVCWRK